MPKTISALAAPMTWDQRAERQRQLATAQMGAELERNQAAPPKTPDAVKRAAATNTRRRMVLHAGPELVGTTQLAAELGLAPSTLKKLAVRMGCAKLGRAFYFSKEQADAVRADPPRGRVRTPKNGKAKS